MAKYYIEMKETRRNMMSDALLSLYRKKGPESEEARQMGLKLWDFDLKEKRMEITSDEQRVLRHALNDLRNQRLEEGKYTDGVEAAIMEVMKPHRTKHFPLPACKSDTVSPQCCPAFSFLTFQTRYPEETDIPHPLP